MPRKNITEYMEHFFQFLHSPICRIIKCVQIEIYQSLRVLACGLIWTVYCPDICITGICCSEIRLQLKIKVYRQLKLFKTSLVWWSTGKIWAQNLPYCLNHPPPLKLVFQIPNCKTLNQFYIMGTTTKSEAPCHSGIRQ